jgi:hypothetical protein
MKKIVVIQPAITKTITTCDFCKKEKEDIVCKYGSFTAKVDICKDCLTRIPEKIRVENGMFNNLLGEFIEALKNYHITFPLDSSKVYVFFGGKEDRPSLHEAKDINEAKKIAKEIDEESDEEDYLNGFIINNKLVTGKIEREIKIEDE